MLGKKTRVQRTSLGGKIDHVLRVCSREVAIEIEEKADFSRIRYQNDRKEPKFQVRVSNNSEGIHRNKFLKIYTEISFSDAVFGC